MEFRYFPVQPTPNRSHPKMVLRVSVFFFILGVDIINNRYHHYDGRCFICFTTGIAYTRRSDRGN